MRVLLFGPTGQVGRELCAILARRDWTLVAVDRRRADLAVDGQAEACILTERPDVVVNATAYNLVDKAESEPDAAMQINARSPGEMAGACASLKIPIIHISSDFVFDGSKQGPYGEDDPARPLSAYGSSKLAGEEAVRAATEHHVIIRTAWVFSEHGANFVKTMLRLGAERDSLGIVNDQLGCPTSAVAIARSVAAVIEALSGENPKKFGTFHFCGAQAVTWFEFARTIFELAGSRIPGSLSVKPITTKDYPTAAERPANSVLSCEKIADVYGIPAHDWRRDLETVVGRLLS